MKPQETIKVLTLYDLWRSNQFYDFKTNNRHFIREQ